MAALRRAARERGGPLPSIDVADTLLDERLANRGRAGEDAAVDARSASTLGTVADESSRESIAFFVNSGVIKPSITYAGVLSGKRHNENGSEGDPGSCFSVQPSSH